MTIRAKYSGTCTRCGGRINPGEMIEWSRGAGSRHVTCPTAAVEAKSAFDAAPIHFGTVGRYREEAPTVGSTFREHDHGIITVVGVQAHYVSPDWAADNDWFDLEDGGYQFSVAARPATEKEAAPILAAEAKREARRQAEERIAGIARHMQEQGERPERPAEGQIEIGGGRILDRQNIYGGGNWFQVNTEHIYYVENHGMDGDDWGNNNVATGGAGGIGWRIPRDADTERQLLELEAVLDPAAAARRQPLPAAAPYCKAPHVDTTVWPEPEGQPIAPPRAVWGRIGDGTVLCGLDASGALWLGVNTHDAPDLTGRLGYIGDNYALALRYADTPDRLAAYRALLPAWVEPAVVAPVLAVAPTGGSPKDWRAGPEGERGRYRLPGGNGWAACARDALISSVLRGLCVNDIEMSPGVELLHANGESRFTGHPWGLWSDGAATIGECHSAPTCPMPKAASDLIGAAIRQQRWTEGSRWRSLITVEDIRVIETVREREVRQFSSSQSAILERITVRHNDGREEALLRLSEEGGAMGEDGDAWDSVKVYRPEEMNAALEDFAATFVYFDEKE